MKKVFLEELPKWEEDEGFGKPGTINWNKAIGCKVKFVYDDIRGEILIINYYKKDKRYYLTIKYLNNDTFEISRSNFYSCILGGVLGIKTNMYKQNVGDIICGKFSKIKIIEHIKIRGEKYYKYKCMVCGNIDTISEGNLKGNKGCNVCCVPSTKILKGYNDVATTHPYLVKYFKNVEDAYKYSYNSTHKCYFVCPICKNIIYKSIEHLCNDNFSCPKCSDKISYPEKVLFNVLEQLGIKFKREFVPKWCTYIDFNDINKKKTGRYDFLLKDVFIDGKQVIVETDGRWHNEDNNISGIKKEESEYIDFTKDTLALENGYKVIRIDCKKSDLDYIKQNIINSKLNEIFDLNKVNWLKCEEFALSSRVKEACDLWNKGIKSTREIGCLMKLSYPTIIRYLTKGEYIGWTTYNGREELIKGAKKQGKNGKLVEIFKGDKSLGIFESCAELSRKSEELFDIKFNLNGIVRVCNKERSHHKGYIFRYI